MLTNVSANNKRKITNECKYPSGSPHQHGEMEIRRTEHEEGQGRHETSEKRGGWCSR